MFGRFSWVDREGLNVGFEGDRGAVPRWAARAQYPPSVDGAKSLDNYGVSPTIMGDAPEM